MRVSPAATMLTAATLAVSLIAAPSFAGSMHARAQVGLGITGQTTGHNNCANAYQATGSCWVSAKECKGTNSVNKAVACGDKGSGHAHHHGGNSPQEIGIGTEGSGGTVTPDPPTMLPGTAGNNAFARQEYATVGALGDSLRVMFDSESSFVQVDLSVMPPGQHYYNDIAIEVDGERSVVSLTGTSGSPVSVSRTGRFAAEPYTVTNMPGTEIYYLTFDNPITFDVPGNIEDTDVAIESNGCPGSSPCTLIGNDPVPGVSPGAVALLALATLGLGAAVALRRRREGRLPA